MEIAKYAVKEITDDFEESNEWALQHVDKVTSKVVKGKYIIYNLSLHMTETTCTRGTPGVYSENCLLRASAPSNYCEVTALQSLRSSSRRISRKTCAGYNVSQYF